MEQQQSTDCKVGTYVHHACAAASYGQWGEAERLMAKAAALIETEAAA